MNYIIIIIIIIITGCHVDDITLDFVQQALRHENEANWDVP